MTKIILGTVQLGLPYGINNGVMPELNDSLSLLEYAYDSGIRQLDTARSYGTSLEVIGKYHKKNPGKKFEVYSKFVLENIQSDFYQTLKKQCEIMQVDSLAAVYFHRFDEYMKSPELIKNWKHRELVSDLGVSIYTADEFVQALSDELVDIIQIPMSIFHHHSSLKNALEKNSNSKKVCVRSIYLQGLLFVPYSKLTGVLEPFIEVRMFIDNLANELKMSKEEIAASYAMDLKNTYAILFGAETSAQVEDNLKKLKKSSYDWDYLLKDMPVVDERILHPGNWK